MKLRSIITDLLVALIGILLVFAAIYFYSKQENIDIIGVLKALGLERMLSVILILFLSEVIKAVRLYFFLRISSVKASILHSVIARLVGNFFSAVTPMSLGGTPARAVALMGLVRGGAGYIAASTLLESFFDAMFMAVVSLFVSFFYIEKAWLLLIVSMYMFILWLVGLIYIVRKEEPGFLKKERKGFVGSFLRVAKYHYTFFREAVRIISSKKIGLIAILLTALSYIVSAFAVAVLLFTPSLIKLYEEIITGGIKWFYLCFVASLIVQILLAIPIPGGAFGTEYLLLGILPKESAMLWRIASYLYMVIPGILLILLLPAVKGKVVRRAKENIYLEENNPA